MLPPRHTFLSDVSSEKSEKSAVLSKQQPQPKKRVIDRQEGVCQKEEFWADNTKHEGLVIMEEGGRTEKMTMEESKEDAEQERLVVLEEGRRTGEMVMEEPKGNMEQEEQVCEIIGDLVGGEEQPTLDEAEEDDKEAGEQEVTETQVQPQQQQQQPMPATAAAAAANPGSAAMNTSEGGNIWARGRESGNQPHEISGETAAGTAAASRAAANAG